jgi:hypothetical protein
MHGLVLPYDAQTTRSVGSGAASTSGRMANAAAGVSQGLTALLYNQGVETDALIRLEVCARLPIVSLLFPLPLCNHFWSGPTYGF